MSDFQRGIRAGLAAAAKVADEAAELHWQIAQKPQTMHERGAQLCAWTSAMKIVCDIGAIDPSTVKDAP